MKKNTIFLIYTSLFLSFSFCVQIQADSVKEPLSLTELSRDSDVIFSGHISETTSKIPGPLPNWSGGGMQGILKVSEFATVGKYHFVPDHFVRGKDYSDEAGVEIPSLYSIYFQGAFHVKKDLKVLIFLKKKDGGFHPTDELRPFLPLSDNTNQQTNVAASVDDQLIDIVTRQLNTQYRSIAIDYLRDIRSTFLVEAVAPYFNDEDLRFRDSVLSILAAHQQVATIPAILRLEAELKAKDKRLSPQSLTRLGAFSGTPEAEPFLLPLLFHSNRYVRVNAMFGLNKTKSRVAIPYFLLGLEDDAGHGLVWRASSALLDEIIFGKPKNQQIRDRAEFIKWWQDALSGKNPTDEEAEKPRVSLQDGQNFEAKDVPQLNEALFQKSRFTRRIAAQALNKLGDQSSIPYLIVALYDPDHEAGWNAYLALRRLVRELPNPASRSQFETARETYSKAATQWWRQALDKADAELDRAFASPPPPKIANPTTPTP